MSFDFDVEKKLPNPRGSLTESGTVTEPYKYYARLCHYAKKLPTEVLSQSLVKKWTSFITDCAIQTEYNLIEGNQDVKTLHKDNVGLCYPILFINISFPEYSGYIKLCNSLKEVVYTTGRYLNGEYYVAKHEVRIKDLLEQYLPNVVFKMIEQTCITITDENLDKELIKVFSATCTADYWNYIGTLDSNMRSTLTLYELEKLFEIPEEHNPLNMTHTFRNKITTQVNNEILNKRSDVIFETENAFLYITHNSGKLKLLDPNGWSAPSSTHNHNPFILYILTKSIIEEWAEEEKFLSECAKIIDRIASKPILVFEAKDVVCRGDIQIQAAEVYNVLEQTMHEFPVLLEFKGVYNVDDANDNGMLPFIEINDCFTLNN